MPDETPVRSPTIMTLRQPAPDSAELVITGKPVRRGNTYVWDVSQSQVKLIGAQCAQAVLNWPAGEVPFQ